MVARGDVPRADRGASRADRRVGPRRARRGAAACRGARPRCRSRSSARRPGRGEGCRHVDMPTAHGVGSLSLATRPHATPPASQRCESPSPRPSETTTTEYASPIAVGERRPARSHADRGRVVERLGRGGCGRNVPVALGTQTGGSVIRPASHCGIVGRRATSMRSTGASSATCGSSWMRSASSRAPSRKSTLVRASLLRGARIVRPGSIGPLGAPPRLATSRSPTGCGHTLRRSTRRGGAAATPRRGPRGQRARAGRTVRQRGAGIHDDRVRETAATACRASWPTTRPAECAAPRGCDDARAISDADFHDAQRIAAACRARLADAFERASPSSPWLRPEKRPPTCTARPIRHSPRCGR